PIYPETKGLTSKGIRYFTEFVLHNLEPIKEFMPIEILRQNGLPEVNVALRAIHLPHNITEAENARRRFAFEELFLLQLKNIYQKAELAKERAPSICIKNGFVHQILSGLPFKLTESQNKSLGEILHGLSRSQPMNRLLQGDVGSGKTIVAGIAAIAAASDDYQIALMAPTEILARQHYKTLRKFFGGFDGGIGLLVSKEARTFYGDELETDVKKASFLREISSGKVKIIVGTHALIEKNVEFQKLGLVAVDEQHRFGVRQRAALMKKGSMVPHFLSMSATPIPRTIMMTVFGDLDLSTINERPLGRKDVITKIVDSVNRGKAYAFIRGQVRRGRQVFVICPRIETDDLNEKIKNQNEKLSERQLAILEVRNVKEEHEKLSKKIFPDLRVAMLHGKMRAKEKEIIMNKFVNGDVDILISTSVVEVGVDVPNATIMMIEGAERFGLAQLYQFRGRVGRGEYQSFCFLFSESTTKSVHQRLESLLTAKNGFELAEKDLAIRGPGQFLGEEQAGMPDVAMKALKDPNLVKNTRAAAEKIMESDPSLDKHQNLKLRLSQFKKEIHLE
ncbi:MAG: ATP-dependent DNA helicase RecG, partial [Candidatus Colwellbacteria bacterium]|nr:ATP-dependent DNA helicase RecG [Candidatus Colwellbacteria bacterium]